MPMLSIACTMRHLSDWRPSAAASWEEYSDCGLELHVAHRLQLIGNDRPPFPQGCDCRFRTVGWPNIASRNRDDWPIAVADETGINRQRIGSGTGKVTEMA